METKKLFHTRRLGSIAFELAPGQGQAAYGGGGSGASGSGNITVSIGELMVFANLS